MAKRKIIMDVDTGTDDAVALVLAILGGEVELLGVTTVNGNLELKLTTDNTLRVVECCKPYGQVPVYSGCEYPLVSTLSPYSAQSRHPIPKREGTSKKFAMHRDHLPLPETTLKKQDKNAVVWLIETVMASEPGSISLVALAPLTNIAAAMRAEPAFASRLGEIALMGGGDRIGNASAAAEFNILVDPEAAELVFRSGVPITMAGLDVTEKALIFPEDFERIRALGNPVSDIVAQWLEFFYKFHKSIGYEGAPMHDPCAVMALPELFESEELYVAVELSGEYCRGTTVGDRRGQLGHAPNARVLFDLDRAGFARLLAEKLLLLEGCTLENGGSLEIEE